MRSLIDPRGGPTAPESVVWVDGALGETGETANCDRRTPSGGAGPLHRGQGRKEGEKKKKNPLAGGQAIATSVLS